MVRAVAGLDHDLAARALAWPLRELLIAYVAWAREQAQASYRHDQLLYALSAPHSKNPMKRPSIPGILKHRHVDA